MTVEAHSLPPATTTGHTNPFLRDRLKKGLVLSSLEILRSRRRGREVQRAYAAIGEKPQTEALPATWNFY